MPTINLQSKYLEDAQGNKYAPITTPNAVRWPDGSNLNDHLGGAQVTPIVLLGQPSGDVPEHTITFDPSTSKFYQYLWDDNNQGYTWQEIATLEKAFTYYDNGGYYEIDNGVLSQTPIERLDAGWYSDFAGWYAPSVGYVGVIMYFDEWGNLYRAVSWDETYRWDNKSNFSGDYNDLSNKPTIPTVPTFSSLTLSGTAQAYDGTHTLKVQDGTSSQKGIVQLGTTSSTAALGNHAHGNLTNAGALQTTDISIASGDKLVVTDSSNSSKVARTSITFDGLTATKALTQKGTWETFLTSHQDISGKEDKMTITTKSSGTTLSAALNTYYRCTYNVGTLAVTLPTVSETTKVQSVVLYMTFGTSPNLTISAPSGVNVYFHETYDIKASGTYEINCIYNGAAWVVASTKITVS